MQLTTLKSKYCVPAFSVDAKGVDWVLPFHGIQATALDTELTALKMIYQLCLHVRFVLQPSPFQQLSTTPLRCIQFELFDQISSNQVANQSNQLNDSGKSQQAHICVG